MKSIDESPVFFTSIIFVAALAVGCISWVTKSHFGAASFSRVTGKQVSTWEAMWIELRTQETSKEKQP